MLDAQLPRALALLLRTRGVEVTTARELNLQEATDNALWHLALNQSLVIITKDQDFAQRSQQSTARPTVVWLRIGNCSNARLLAWFRPLWPGILELLQRGESFIEVT